MSYSTEDTPGIKKFYTEKELQNEDDKGARGPKRPEAVPPANDNRTLYEKLQENKMKMDEDFADKVKYSMTLISSLLFICLLYLDLSLPLTPPLSLFPPSLFQGPPKGLEQEDIDFFEERARKRLIREIENEEADQSELEKVFVSFLLCSSFILMFLLLFWLFVYSFLKFDFKIEISASGESR